MPAQYFIPTLVAFHFLTPQGHLGNGKGTFETESQEIGAGIPVLLYTSSETGAGLQVFSSISSSPDEEKVYLTELSARYGLKWEA